MSDSRWLRLQWLFDALIDLPPHAREQWLAEQPDDDGLKREALALVDADGRGSNAITRRFGSAVSELATSPAHGMQLGPYRLLREIGSGGMGTVFLAERADAEFDRQVAIKLIRGVPTRDAAERLRRERQILAHLEHPHIARLLDGGTTAEGQPYLVMEYIAGEPITHWCSSNQLSISSRLELFRKVCMAVQYAHQRLIIHRDLKPANVLVRKDGEPALLDFGIAKLLDPAASARQEPTAAQWFTPTYASPEQRRGETVNTASDVYALGLVLYEVLFEQIPKTDADGTLDLRQARQSAQPVPAELGLVIAKATHPEPSRRYASPEALSEDLRRYLRGRPILAAPDSWSYRTRKFLSRHPVAMAMVAAAIVSVSVATWRLAAERDRALRAEAEARRESATSRHVVDYLVALFENASPENAGNRPISPKELIDRGRRAADERLADEPVQRARLLAAFGRIYTELGDPDAAASSFRAAAQIEKDQGNPVQHAKYLHDVGYVLNLAERSEDAEPLMQQVIADLERHAPTEYAEIAGALSGLSLAQARNGDPLTALTTARRSRELADTHGVTDPLVLSRTYTALAEAHMRANQLVDAEAAATKAMEVLRTHYPEESPEAISGIGFLTEVYERQGRHADQERVLRRMLAVRLKTLDPGSGWAVTVRNNLANAIQLQGRLFEAIALLKENLGYLRKNGQQDTPSYAITVNNVASLAEQTEDFATAIELFREAYNGSLPKPGENASPRVAVFRQNLGRSLMLAGRLDEALPLLQREIEDSMDTRTERARRLVHLGEWMRRHGKYAEALRFAEQADAAFREFLPPTHARLGAVAKLRGLILRDQNKLPEATEQLRNAVDYIGKGIGEEANATLDAKVQLAELLLAQGKPDEARSLVSAIATPIENRFVEGSPLRKQFAALTSRLPAP
ncbi:serine/threonine-protein kinase [Tahibacter amnicola]|uniref:Protein kinase n=1 Tax=Tahibacter amnicola TaxID=2976241 RepID=A0ABY6BC26_9GAMM|nr:serine/threonine-protein kinase [Tahibacter amnicola]UXI66718.1 protein kinase [Tahibacter amnicola]